MFLRIYGLASPRDIIKSFRLQRLKGPLEGFVYCLQHFFVGKYDLEARETTTYFQIVKAAYQELIILEPTEKDTFTYDFKLDHNYHFIPYLFVEDYKPQRTESSGAGPSSSIAP